MKKELRAWVILVALQLLWIIPCAYDYTHQDPKEEVVIETTQEETEVHINEVEVETVAEPQEEVADYEGIKFYNVPLSKEVQMHLFIECDGYNIAPAIIIAMIERESTFDANKIGDNGESFGLMQIQPKWHAERMERLGCTNLFDPFQNITVGIDFVAELKDQNPDLYWVLMHYNMRWSSADKLWNEGIYSEYAKQVVERASEIQRELEERH